MTTRPLDDYVREVAAHLKLRGRTRRQALADLLEILTEQAVASSEAQAIADAGLAANYAAELDAQFGTTDGAFPTLFGIPNSFTRGVGKRLAGTFNPADPRLLVPKVIGAGWDLNLGAIAVQLRLLNPDDVDDEVLDEATAYLPLARAVASVPAALGLGATALLFTRRKQAARLSGKSQTVNLVFGTLTPALAAVLIAAAGDDDLPANQRLTIPGLAAFLGVITAGSGLQYALRPRGQTIVLCAVLAAWAAQLGFSYLPVRETLARHQSVNRS